MTQMSMIDIEEEFPNSAGWEVIHDANDQLFYIVAKNGRRQEGSYTTRIFATVALKAYLLKQKPGPGRGHKSKPKEYNLPRLDVNP